MSDENSREENERMKFVIQTLSKENEELKQRITASEWLVAQNKTVSEECKKLQIQLHHWKIHANDANDRLARMNSKKVVPSHVDIFYDNVIRRYMEALGAENELLVKHCNEQLKDKHGAEYIKTINILKNNVKSLREELERKFREYRRLQISIENVENEDRLCNELVKIEGKYSLLQRENANLKAYLMQKNDIMVYMKGLFDKQRTEFLKIFKDCLLKNGDEFMKQLQDLEDDLPEFLTKPLVTDADTNTEVKTFDDKEMVTETTSQHIPLPVVKATNITDFDERYDSGVVSLTEEIRYLTVELKKSKDKEGVFAQSEKDLQRSQENIKELEISKQSQEKHITEIENELASWKTALKYKEDEAEQFKKERDEYEDKNKTLEVINMNLSQQLQYNQQGVELKNQNDELREKVQTLEEINHNLHCIIQEKKPRQQTQPQPVLQKSYSETQAGQMTPSRYTKPEVIAAAQQEYDNMMRMQRQQPVSLPPEPWQSAQSPWLQYSHRRDEVVRDGFRPDTPPPRAVAARDTRIDNQYGPPSKRSPPPSEFTHLYEGLQRHTMADSAPSRRRSSPSNEQTQCFPLHVTSDYNSPIRGSPVESMERRDDSWSAHAEVLYPCKKCGARFPSSMYMEHIRTCGNQQYNE